jgi:NAD(P)-dependent dehydrogenase (short-subunit alcohol dehydrogenase family)
LPEPPALLDASGRTLFLAGAAGGIGRATAELFAAAGARLVLADLNADALPAESVTVLPLALDASDETSFAAALDAAAQRFGALDYLVNAVGETGSGRLDETRTEEWDRLMAINLTSCFLLAREGYKHLRKPGGVLILLSSSDARNGGSALSGAPYATAKAGVSNLARYLAREWAPDGLRVNCLAPGPVDTPMLDRLNPEQHTALKAAIPLGRYTSGREVAAAIAFLCSDHAASTTGASTNISGGLVLD